MVIRVPRFGVDGLVIADAKEGDDGEEERYDEEEKGGVLSERGVRAGRGGECIG